MGGITHYKSHIALIMVWLLYNRQCIYTQNNIKLTKQQTQHEEIFPLLGA